MTSHPLGSTLKMSTPLLGEGSIRFQPKEREGCNRSSKNFSKQVAAQGLGRASGHPPPGLSTQRCSLCRAARQITILGLRLLLLICFFLINSNILSFNWLPLCISNGDSSRIVSLIPEAPEDIRRGGALPIFLVFWKPN